MDQNNIREICTYCGKGFTDAQKLENHLKYHRNVHNYPCKLCNKTFHSPSLLEQHEFKHRGQKPHKCGECGKGFAFMSSFKRHATTVHNPNIPQRHKYKYREKKPFKCDKCGKTFAFFSSIKRHVNTACVADRGEKRSSSNQCGEALGMTSQPEDHKYASYVGPHHCYECGKTFSQSGSLKMHMFIHQGIKPYLCNICGKAFTHAGTLSNHKYSHTGVKPYHCDLCDWAFPKPSILAKHRLIHFRKQKLHGGDQSGVTLVESSNPVHKKRNHYSEEKAHKCGQCGKAFKNESALRDHSLWHSKNVAIPCGECGIVFWSRQVYLSHRCLVETDKVAVSL